MNTQNYPPPTIVNDYILGIQYGDFDDDITTSSDYGSGLIRENCKLNGPNCWLASNSDKNGFIQETDLLLMQYQFKEEVEILNELLNLEFYGHLMEKNILIYVN